MDTHTYTHTLTLVFSTVRPTLGFICVIKYSAPEIFQLLFENSEQCSKNYALHFYNTLPVCFYYLKKFCIYEMLT